MTERFVEAAIDGCWVAKKSRGGWAGHLRCNRHDHVVYHWATHTTENRMVVSAAITVLEQLPEPCSVEIHTRSEYFCGCARQLLSPRRDTWVASVRAGTAPNADLWQRLLKATQGYSVSISWLHRLADYSPSQWCAHAARSAAWGKSSKLEPFTLAPEPYVAPSVDEGVPSDFGWV
jgi:ribonuclease HI